MYLFLYKHRVINNTRLYVMLGHKFDLALEIQLVLQYTIWLMGFSHTFCPVFLPIQPRISITTYQVSIVGLRKQMWSAYISHDIIADSKVQTYSMHEGTDSSGVSLSTITSGISAIYNKFFQSSLMKYISVSQQWRIGLTFLSSVPIRAGSSYAGSSRAFGAASSAPIWASSSTH